MVNVMQDLEIIMEGSEVSELLQRIYFFNSKRDGEFEVDVLIEAAIDDEVRSSVEDPYDWIRGRSVYVEEAIDEMWEQGETMIEEVVTEAQYRWWRNLIYEDLHEVILIIGLRQLRFVTDDIPVELLDIYEDEAYHTTSNFPAKHIGQRFLTMREDYLKGSQKIIVGEYVKEVGSWLPKELVEGMDDFLTADSNKRVYKAYEDIVNDVIYGSEDRAKKWMEENLASVEKYINDYWWEGSMLATSMEARKLELIEFIDTNLLSFVEYTVLRTLDSEGYDHITVRTYNMFVESLSADPKSNKTMRTITLEDLRGEVLIHF